MHKRTLTKIALLAAFITVSGAIKIPSIVAGTEFQLSAPIAVAICYVFGLKVYLLSGMLSSLLGLILGTQNLFNIAIALVFRLMVALVLFTVGRNKFSLVIAGPIASATARLTLSLFVDKLAYALIVAAIPGMIYTAVLSIPLALVLERVKKEFWRSEHAL